MRKRKIYYVPGLISLLILPVLLLLLGPEDPERLTVLRMNLPSDDTVATELFSKRHVYAALKGKKIEQISLNSDNYFLDQGNDYLNERKFYFVRNEMERLQFTHDTSTILKVEFAESNTYGQYITVLNLAKLYHFQRYAFADDAFFFFPDEPPQPQVSEEYIPQSFDLGLPPYVPPGRWEMFWSQMKFDVSTLLLDSKQNLLLSIGFFLLIVVPSLIRIFRKKPPYLTLNTNGSSPGI